MLDASYSEELWKEPGEGGARVAYVILSDYRRSNTTSGPFCKFYSSKSPWDAVDQAVLERRRQSSVLLHLRGTSATPAPGSGTSCDVKSESQRPINSDISRLRGLNHFIVMFYTVVPG